MKSITRIKNHSANTILAKIHLIKTSKNENSFLLEGLLKDGTFISDFLPKISNSESQKLINAFSQKMKKCAYSEFTPVYSPNENVYYLFINPEIMEKERVGFEFYGLLSARNANSNLVAYYSFADKDTIDFRQELTNHTNTFGFFSLMNFESDGGFKAGLNEIGITYTLIDKSENNFLFLSLDEYKRQFKKDAVIEPKKQFKNKSALPPEIKKFINNEEKSQKQDIIEEKPEIKSKTSKKEEPKKVEIKTAEPVKRGRGRPPKNK